MRGSKVDFERLAGVVREKRKEKGITQKGLGERFGLSQTYVGWLELGKGKRLGKERIREILSFLGIDLSKFIISEGPEVAREKVGGRERTFTPEAVRKQMEVRKEPPVPVVVREKVEVRDRPSAPEVTRKVSDAPPVEGERKPPVSEIREKGQNIPRRSGGEPWTSGKEKKRFWEWLNERTRIKVKLNNGEVAEGFIKWYDTYTLKFVTSDSELVIPKHSILYYVDAPRSSRDKERGR